MATLPADPGTNIGTTTINYSTLNGIDYRCPELAWVIARCYGQHYARKRGGGGLRFPAVAIGGKITERTIGGVKYRFQAIQDEARLIGASVKETLTITIWNADTDAISSYVVAPFDSFDAFNLSSVVGAILLP